MAFYSSKELITVAKGGQPTNQKMFDNSKKTILDSTDNWINRLEKELEEAKRKLEEYPEEIKALQAAKAYANKTNNLLPLAKMGGFLNGVSEDLGALVNVVQE